MKRELVIEKIDGIKYYLRDMFMNRYVLMMELYDIDKDLMVNDKIYIDEMFINNRNILYAFGAIDGIYGRDVGDIKDQDVIYIDSDNKRIYLKRFYG